MKWKSFIHGKLFQSRRYLLAQHGYTLIEVAVAMIIITILVMFVGMNINNWRANILLRETAVRLHGNLQKAKIFALKTNQNVTVTFVTSPAPCPLPADLMVS